jgi:hypothetical protein
MSQAIEGAAVGAGGAVGTLAATQAGLSAVGFSAAGPVAGSIAAGT